ncbi:unnamed protein product [Phytophthora fragariaefolia]|uniref:Unnamed protein product n=1 Tax=Phytophthora fragariaefolia TaxID=1490495 RepID=A0A9W7D6I8_9STRA|nr:unnamed protein product [Phytophthora fragariaefolia]
MMPRNQPFSWCGPGHFATSRSEVMIQNVKVVYHFIVPVQYLQCRMMAGRLLVTSWTHHIREFIRMTDKLANLAMDSNKSIQVVAADIPNLLSHWSPVLSLLHGDVEHWICKEASTTANDATANYETANGEAGDVQRATAGKVEVGVGVVREPNGPLVRQDVLHDGGRDLGRRRARRTNSVPNFTGGAQPEGVLD